MKTRRRLALALGLAAKVAAANYLTTGKTLAAPAAEHPTRIKVEPPIP